MSVKRRVPVLDCNVRRRRWLALTLSALPLTAVLVSRSAQVSRADAGEVVSGYGRGLRFSGYDWLAKTSTVLVGPGPNYFSDGPDNVWIDDQDRMHLRLTRDATSRWWASEVVLQASLGYGSYTFKLDGPPNELDVYVVFGMFTWNDDPTDSHRELDIELARWGIADGPNGRYSVQPYQLPDRMYDFQQPFAGSRSSHRIDWMPGRVRFQSWMGWQPSPPTLDAVIADHVFESGIPKPGGEQTRMNLWLLRGLVPHDTTGTEVIVSGFEFDPGPLESGDPTPIPN